MARIRARVEERSRREASAEAEPEPSPAAESGSGATRPQSRITAVPPPSASFAFHGKSIYWSSRGRGVGKLLHASRRLLAPFVKFLFNIDPMVDALAIQATRNAQQAAFDDDVARRLAAREERDALNRRAVENLSAEMERLAADMKNHRTLAASVVERLDALDRARGGGHAAKPQDGGQADERPDEALPASRSETETPPPTR